MLTLTILAMQNFQEVHKSQQ